MCICMHCVCIACCLQHGHAIFSFVLYSIHFPTFIANEQHSHSAVALHKRTFPQNNHPQPHTIIALCAIIEQSSCLCLCRKDVQYMRYRFGYSGPQTSRRCHHCRCPAVATVNTGVVVVVVVDWWAGANLLKVSPFSSLSCVCCRCRRFEYSTTRTAHIQTINTDRQTCTHIARDLSEIAAENKFANLCDNNIDAKTTTTGTTCVFRVYGFWIETALSVCAYIWRKFSHLSVFGRLR